MDTKNRSGAMIDDARDQTKQIRSDLESLTRRLREAIDRTNDPRAKALYETTAEVLGGLSKAYADFEKKEEPAWRN